MSGSKVMKTQLLLLDLDCVTVFGLNGKEGILESLLLLHPDIVQSLEKIDIPVVLLTHRSKKDAIYIQKQLALRGVVFAGLICSQDLFHCAIRNFKLRHLFMVGLSKSLSLNKLEQDFGVDRSGMVLIDDREENLLDLLNVGLMNGILAPFTEPDAKTDQSVLSTFDFNEAIKYLQSENLVSSPIIRLKPCMRYVSELEKIGEISHTDIGLLESMRKLANKLRVFIRSYKR